MSISLIYHDKDIYYPIATKEITRTEQIWLDEESNGILSDSSLCHISKNLWNESNYLVRKDFIGSYKSDGAGFYAGFTDLYHLVKNTKNFRSLPSSVARQCLMILDRSWKPFFTAVKDWKNNPSKYLGRPKLPGYKKKDGEFLLIFSNQQVKIKDGFLIFPKKINNKPTKLRDFKIKTRLDNETNIREVRIIPGGNKKYKIEIVYKIEEHQLDLNKDRIIGTDFGLRNIVTISNNVGEKPICIKGGVLKSINQYYNKKRSKIMSIYNKQPIKCSFIDDEPVGHSGNYLGKRISRGLFRSSNGKLINADVQGAYNIIKKAFPKSFTNLKVIREDGIEGVGLHPIRINPLIC